MTLKFAPPTPESTGDKLHAVAKGAIGCIPVAGSLAAELFNLVIAPPLQQRVQDWMDEVGAGLRQLEATGRVTWAELRADPSFTTTFVQATEAARRTHEQEKIEALRNTVLNSALPDAPKDARRQMFLSLLNDFTTWHLFILNLISDPAAYHGGDADPESTLLAAMLEKVFHGQGLDGSFFAPMINDLQTRGVVERMLGRFDELRVRDYDLTEYGKQFLKFISHPLA
jgi:hypothetical protein